MSDPSAAVPPAIELVEVHKSFERGTVPVLDGLNLSVAPREFVAVTGPSGCGKSTLLYLIAALDRADSGRVTVNGTDLDRLPDADGYRRNEVGLIFQLHNLLPHLSALQNVEIAMVGTGRSRREQRERARELLDAAGLGGKEQRKPPQLSGGERQRVAIARALANEPRILLADEPTGSLDSHAVEQVLELFTDLREQHAITILLVTHDATVAAAADRIVHMLDGRVEVDAVTT